MEEINLTRKRVQKDIRELQKKGVLVRALIEMNDGW